MHHLGITGQRGGTNPVGLLTHPVEDIIGSVDDTSACGIRNGLQHNEIAKPLQQINGEPTRVVSGVDHRFDRTEQRAGVTGSKRVDGIVDQGDVGDTQQRQCPWVVHSIAVGAGQQLV